MGRIPYYMWVGCSKVLTSREFSPNYSFEIIERLDAAVTESPSLLPINKPSQTKYTKQARARMRSKLFDTAVANLSADIPLPSLCYQNSFNRIHYEDNHPNQAQFKGEYLYAFVWEDVQVDKKLLNIGSEDVILAICSAGDNILTYALESPKSIHAVDMNPYQGHLLELKIASFKSLPYSDVWKLFGEGRHADFRDILTSKLSPYLSSRAFQYWLDNAHVFTSRRGLYETGGSRHAIKLVRYIFTTLGLSSEVKKLAEAKTMNEQREIWHRSIRGVLFNRLLSWLVIGNEKFLWRALGVPPEQRNMIQNDYLGLSGLPGAGRETSNISGQAVWEYLVNTIEPVVENTLISKENYFYLLCLRGSYTKQCVQTFLFSIPFSLLY
jgi:betaine lipid synthase